MRPVRSLVALLLLVASGAAFAQELPPVLDELVGLCQKALTASPDDARPLLRRAVSFTYPDDATALLAAALLHDGGKEFFRKDRFADARVLFLGAAEIRSRLAPDSIELGRSLTNLGTVARRMGRSTEALGYFARALPLLEGKDSQLAAGCCINLGNLSYDNRDDAAATQYYLRAIALLERIGEKDETLAKAKKNLASVYRRTGNLELAEANYRAVLEWWESNKQESADLSGILTGLGNLSMERGQWDEARDSLDRARVLVEKMGPDSLDAAEVYQALGYYFSNRPEADTALAEQYYRKALAIREARAPLARSTAETLKNLGNLARERGELQQAESYYQRAWDLVRERGASIQAEETRQAFGAGWDDVMGALLSVQHERGRDDAALRTLDEGRAQSLRELLARRHSAASALDPEARGRWEEAQAGFEAAYGRVAAAAAELARVKSELQTNVEMAQPEEVLQPLRARLLAAEKKFDSAETALTEKRLVRDRAWAALIGEGERAAVEPMPLDAARKALPPGSVFVAFSVRTNGAFGFIAPADPKLPVSGFVVEREHDAVAQQVETFRRYLGAGEEGRGVVVSRGEPALHRAARLMFNALVPEQHRATILGASHLVISPDGPLWQLPFAALVTNAEGPPTWLGLTIPITITPSLSVFAGSSERGVTPMAPGATALVVGDPSFSGDETASGLRRDGKPAKPAAAPRAQPVTERSLLLDPAHPPRQLPGARQEAVEVAALYGVPPLLGSEATEPVVRERLSSARVIHFGTHGYFLPERPTASGLLLASPPKGALATPLDDGVLQAWEVATQISLSADLVVLSACETGRGESVRGEGLVGLIRAFQIAGARSVVASHWKVEDRSSGRLMTLLHHRVRTGAPVDTALLDAMRTISSSPETAHPYFWTAFFVSGVR